MHEIQMVNETEDYIQETWRKKKNETKDYTIQVQITWRDVHRPHLNTEESEIQHDSTMNLQYTDALLGMKKHI